MKYKILIILSIIFFITGCTFFDPYKVTNTPSEAIDAWFSYKNGSDDLGKVRKELENIDEIEKKECIYVENDDYLRYVYKCNITYLPIGETIIPLSETKDIMVYVVITYNNDKTYDYIVYNSSSKEKIWLEDDTLNYGKKR